MVVARCGRGTDIAQLIRLIIVDCIVVLIVMLIGGCEQSDTGTARTFLQEDDGRPLFTIDHVEISPDGRYALISDNGSHYASFYDLNSGELVGSFTFPATLIDSIKSRTLTIPYNSRPGIRRLLSLSELRANFRTDSSFLVATYPPYLGAPSFFDTNSILIASTASAFAEGATAKEYGVITTPAIATINFTSRDVSISSIDTWNMNSEPFPLPYSLAALGNSFTLMSGIRWPDNKDGPVYGIYILDRFAHVLDSLGILIDSSKVEGFRIGNEIRFRFDSPTKGIFLWNVQASSIYYAPNVICELYVRNGKPRPKFCDSCGDFRRYSFDVAKGYRVLDAAITPRGVLILLGRHERAERGRRFIAKAVLMNGTNQQVVFDAEGDEDLQQSLQFAAYDRCDNSIVCFFKKEKWLVEKYPL